MPAVITHHLLAQRVLEEIKAKGLQQNLDGDAFFWGAQGPDFFFFHRVLPWWKGESLSEYGGRLHKAKPSEIIAALREYASGGGGLAQSYMCGFFCHYSLDRTAHPFIHDSERKLLKLHPEQSLTVFHNEIEATLDVIMLRYERNDLPIDFDLRTALPANSGVQNMVASMYDYLLGQMFGVSVGRPQVFQATEDARRALGHLNDRTTLKRRFVRGMEDIAKKPHILSCLLRPAEDGKWDYANAMHNTWEKDGELHEESFFELFDAAADGAMKMIEDYFSGKSPLEITQDIPF